MPTQIAQPDIDRSRISEGAIDVVARLREAGFDAYLVGGCVRDLLLGRTPKDFDVATSATPEDVKQVFKRVRLIGRRFRIAHVRAGNEVIEVSTFRRALDFDDLIDSGSLEVNEGNGEDTEDFDLLAEADPNDELFKNPRNDLWEDTHRSDEGIILRDNAYGTMDEDALRRDFTVNALYYDPEQDTVIDYCDGMADIASKTLRIIGDPEARFREDPVRIMRATRFAASLDFTLDEATQAAIEPMAELLTAIPPARLFDEFTKMFLGGSAVATFKAMQEYDLMDILMPLPAHAEPIAIAALQSTDARVAEGKPVTPGFLLAAFLWNEYLDRCDPTLSLTANGFDQTKVANAVIAEQQLIIAIPKRHALFIRDVWTMQPRLERRGGKSPQKVMEHGRFRAAYDFLMLRIETSDASRELGEWWTNIQSTDSGLRAAESRTMNPRRKRRRRRRRGPPSGESQGASKPPTP